MISKSVRNYISDRDGNACQYCGISGEHAKLARIEIEHILPRTAGGSDDESNLVLACRKCNSIASNRVFLTFSQKRDYIMKHRNCLACQPGICIDYTKPPRKPRTKMREIGRPRMNREAVSA